MDMEKEIFWWEIDQVFKARLADRVDVPMEKFEIHMRNEELMFLRDKLKHIWDSKGVLR